MFSLHSLKNRIPQGHHYLQKQHEINQYTEFVFILVTETKTSAAATKVIDGYAEFIQAHAEVPWRNMRNRMAHGYFDINLDVVWETVQEWLPALLEQLPAVR